MLLHLFSTQSDWLQTFLRITLGIVFFAHGAQKFTGWFGGSGLKETLRMMNQQLGLPVALAFAAVAAEFFGGLGLMAGLLSRVAAAGIALTMVFAIAMVHGRHGLFLNWFGNREGHGYEYHLLAIALAAAIVVRGSGAISLDRLLYMWMAV